MNRHDRSCLLIKLLLYNADDIRVWVIAMNVLIIEDDRALLDIYSDIFSFSGHDVATAETIHEAYAILESHLPDVVISDLYLADDNTAAVLDLLTSLARQAVRVAVITGSRDHQGKVEAAGIPFYLKPLSGKTLVEIASHSDSA